MSAPVRRWVADPPGRDVEAALARLAATADVAHVAVMPDVHLAEDVCVGTVVATRRRLFPCAVGGDIGCGVAALAFEAEASALADERVAAAVLEGFYRWIPALKHGRATAPASLPGSLREGPPGDPALAKLAGREGRLQLGTLGRGNHFVELQRDEADRLWCMVHSGSRAVGQAIRDRHDAGATPDAATGLRSLEAETPVGNAYLADLAWALAYAEASRRAIVDAVAAVVAGVLGAPADPASWISCAHNHVRRERHLGEDLLVHRKGAIPAAEGEPGIIPGSMGAASYHVTGRGLDAALGSSSHGAGRCMSRTEARRRISARALRRQMDGVWFDVRAADRLRDEAPAAYKDIGAVMRAQRELTRVVRVLRPVLAYKA